MHGINSRGVPVEENSYEYGRTAQSEPATT